MLLKLRHSRPVQSGLNAFKGKKYQLSFTSQSPKVPDIALKANFPKSIFDYKYVILGSLATGGTAYYFLSEKKYKDTTLFSGRPAKIRTVNSQAVELTYEMDSAEGIKSYTHSHLLLGEKETEQKIKAGEDKVFVNRDNNPVKSWEVNSLPCLETSEDRYSADIITKPDLEELLKGGGFFWQRWWNTRTKLYPKKQGEEVIQGDGKDDIMLFSVFDGHGGPYISDLLSRTLHGCLAWNAAKLFTNGYNNGQEWENTNISGNLEQDIKLGKHCCSFVDGEKKPQSFAQMVALSFLAVDSNLISNIYSTLFNPVADVSTEDSCLPPHSPAQLGLSHLFNNGSCALTAIIDVSTDKLYVANVGDTRAVAGWWNPQKGEWRCDILTEDATCENEKEVERIKSEHPEDEQETAIHNQGYGDTNRVLGGLQPSRACGDHVYKINYSDSEDIWRALDQKEPRRRWKWFEECPNKTPPYVTAKPEVVVRDIHPESGEELKFVVLATDGLWDRVPSEEASYLLAGHLVHEVHPDVPKTELMAACPHSPPLSEANHPYPKEELNVEGKWVFEDTNSATHLVRNCIGGDDRELRQQFMSMKKPGARSVRDDVTAMVIWFDDAKGRNVAVEDNGKGDTTST